MYLRSRSRICCCSGAGIATVWRYIVARVDASLATFGVSRRELFPADDDDEAEQRSIDKSDSGHEGRQAGVVLLANRTGDGAIREPVVPTASSIEAAMTSASCSHTYMDPITRRSA